MMKLPFLAFTLLLIAMSLLSKASFAEGDEIPIPPKRPAVLNVSPAYIEELRNRGRKKNSLIPLPGEIISDNSDKNKNNSKSIKHTAPAEVVIAVKTKKAPPSYIPTPRHKPIRSIDVESARNETTLVSFSLMPEQSTLDDNLKIFLKTRAIDRFNENENLKMEIHAYATAIKGQPNSDVRIALARALKVRSFLIDNEVSPHRLKLIPMEAGNINKPPSNETLDRIDLVFIEME